MTVDELLQSKWGVKFSITKDTLRDGILYIHRPQYIGLVMDEKFEIRQVNEKLEIVNKSAVLTLYMNGATHCVIF